MAKKRRRNICVVDFWAAVLCCLRLCQWIQLPATLGGPVQLLRTTTLLDNWLWLYGGRWVWHLHVGWTWFVIIDAACRLRIYRQPTEPSWWKRRLFFMKSGWLVHGVHGCLDVIGFLVLLYGVCSSPPQWMLFAFASVFSSFLIYKMKCGESVRLALCRNDCLASAFMNNQRGSQWGFHSRGVWVGIWGDAL